MDTPPKSRRDVKLPPLVQQDPITLFSCTSITSTFGHFDTTLAPILDANWYTDYLSLSQTPYLYDSLNSSSFEGRLLHVIAYLENIPINKSSQLHPYKTLPTTSPLDNFTGGFVELCTIIVHFAVTLRLSQRFVDRNHRTAVLMAYELLADTGYVIDIKKLPPIRLYAEVSNRDERFGWDKVVERYARYLRSAARKRVEVAGDVSYRRKVAEAVKVIPVVNSQFEIVRGLRKGNSGEVRGFVKRKWKGTKLMRSFELLEHKRM